MNKKLILVRHAHRDKTPGEYDNGLSERGHRQAKKILEHFKKEFPKDKPKIMSSPKHRCIETIEAIVEYTKTELEISPLLDEGGNVQKKVKKFVEWWEKEAPAFVIACSHGDWLPECLGKLTGKQMDLEKGAWAEITLKKDGPELMRVIQEF